MKPRTLTLIVPNDLAAVSLCQERVRDFFAGHNISARAHYHVEIVLEEVLSNIIAHGLQDGEQEVIDVTISLNEKDISIVVQDGGVPFDPTSVPVPATPTSLAEVPVEGRGLTMVRKIANMEYSYQDGGNRLVSIVGR